MDNRKVDRPAGRFAQYLALGVPALLLGGAYLSQYVFGLYPCEMCWWQRYPHFVAVGFALLSFLAPPRRVWIALAALAIFVSGVIGGFHAGVEYGWWEGITSCANAVPTGGDPMEAIMNTPVIRCDASPWDLFGISLAGWNFLFSCGAGVLVLALLSKGGKAH